MTIRIKVDIDRLSLDDVIFLLDSGGQMPPRFAKQVLAKVVVDEAGVFLEGEAALQAVGQLAIPDVRTAIGEFRQQLASLRENAIPPTNGGS